MTWFTGSAGAPRPGPVLSKAVAISMRSAVTGPAGGAARGCASLRNDGRGFGDHRAKHGDGPRERGRHVLYQGRGKPIGSKHAVEATPRRCPHFEFPTRAQRGLQGSSVARDPGGPGVVLFNRPFEVQAELHDAAADLWLELKVDRRVAVMQLEDCPHDAAARRDETGR